MSQAQNSNCILEDLPLDDTDEMPHLILSSGPHDDDGKNEDSSEK